MSWRYRKRSGGDYTSDRIERALNQRLYLISQQDNSTENESSRKYVVLGSTGNVYDVEFCSDPSCSCPDHQKSDSFCKHILFIMLKVNNSEFKLF